MATVDFEHSSAGNYLREMVEMESRGHGDQVNALDRVGRVCGLSSRALRRLMNGETKDPAFSVVTKIRLAYLAICERHISRLRAKYEAEAARCGDASFEGFGDRIHALSQELQEAKNRAKS